jgi:predicted DNA-binding protein (UPF0278 family)
MNRDQLLEAIRQFFSDRDRSREETRDGLLEARDEIDILLDALK